MKIEGLNPQSMSINYNTYRNSYFKNTKSEHLKKDVIEISDVGRLMKNYSLDEVNINHDSRIEEIKNKIKNNTYNIDSKLTARSILESISGI
ncbi:MAG: flagellar biosynthesis anti-sigma factor FlgM [Clostridium sp.]|nr:flagellar biosynthesis anti-sigma factor FlgM [Clostridium sp.]